MPTSDHGMHSEGQRARKKMRHLLYSRLCGGALAVRVLMIVGLILLLASKGLSYFWPKDIQEVSLKDGSKVWGEYQGRKVFLGAQRDAEARYQIQYKVANRDLYDLDFRWVDEDEITQTSTPSGLLRLERREYGVFIGRLRELILGGEVHRGAVADLMPLLVRKMAERPANETHQWEQEARRDQVVLVTAEGQSSTISLFDVLHVEAPNEMSVFAKAGTLIANLWAFVWEDPRESNTEGGIFPAIFGTILMVFLMTFFVTPFGVLAAIYLREYAKEGPLVRAVRVAIFNLAGVPSIVFGVFGLGFFVYFVGGTIDQLLYPEALPTPTYGTGGILWASLTLALLTVPVVIVATEEALSAVPKEVRQGSYALGATRFETLWRIVVPASLPGIMTGVILAIARAAGEVAPLMIVGMVKLAPVPMDGEFPFLHLDRKFMHLGFHIYDLGFQSPNVEATKPLVYATAFLLVGIVMVMNLVAIYYRNRLRERYASSSV